MFVLELMTPLSMQILNGLVHICPIHSVKSDELNFETNLFAILAAVMHSEDCSASIQCDLSLLHSYVVLR